VCVSGNKLRLGKYCYIQVWNPYTFHLLSKNLKIKIYVTAHKYKLHTSSLSLVELRLKVFAVLRIRTILLSCTLKTEVLVSSETLVTPSTNLFCHNSEERYQH